MGNPPKTKECYWLLQVAKYFKAWGFWRKNNKKTKKLLYECGSSKLEASRTKKADELLGVCVGSVIKATYWDTPRPDRFE